MKNLLKFNNLPWLALVCGAVGLGLHKLLYRVAVDGKNLLVAGHPAEILLWLLSGALAVVTAAAAFKLGSGKDRTAAFPQNRNAALGHFVFSAGILLTVLTQPSAMAGVMGEVWRWLGLAASLLLFWTGVSRLEGKTPCFAAHMVVCAFLAIHIITHYRTWSGDPQLQDYVFTLLGFVSLVLFAYCQTSFDVGFCKPRLLLGSGVMALYLCMVGLPDTRYWMLSVGAMVWVCSGFELGKVSGENVK